MRGLSKTVRVICLAAVLALPATSAWAGGPPWWPWPERHQDLTNTWLDAFNFLDLIPGPPFIWMFAAYAALVIVLVKLLTNYLILPRLEGASILDLGDQVRFELKPSYLELAYLHGDRRAVVEAALCNLYRIGVINSGMMLQNNDPGAGARFARLTGVERAVASSCRHFKSAYELVSEPSVSRALSVFAAAAEEKLHRLGLLAAWPTRAVGVAGALTALLLVEGLGIIRLARSVMRGYTNVELLVAVMVFSLLAIILAFRPRLTRAGAIYLRRMKAEYVVLARKVAARTHPWHAPEVLYAVAACGAAALGGTGYAAIHEAMKPPTQSADGCGGGGCGGGGCGGGGCGGGGCGGG